LLGRLQDLWEGRLVPARCRGRALACRRGRPCSLPDRGPARASWGEAIPEGPIRLLREGPERLRDGRKANELHFGRGLGVLSLCRAEPDKEDSVNFARFWPSRRAVPSGEGCKRRRARDRALPWRRRWALAPQIAFSRRRAPRGRGARPRGGGCAAERVH
jgi:hypothetical protein